MKGIKFYRSMEPKSFLNWNYFQTLKCFRKNLGFLNQTLLEVWELFKLELSILFS